MKNWCLTFLTAFTLVYHVHAQSETPLPFQPDEIKKHVFFLASPKLEGRGTGTKSEKLAADYILESFSKAGLSPFKGEWKHCFTFTPQAIADSKILSIGGKDLVSGEDFDLVSVSGSGKGRLKIIDAGFGVDSNLKFDAQQAALINLDLPNPNNPHAIENSFATVEKRIELAAKAGAKMILFYRKSNVTEAPSTRLSRTSASQNIPVVFLYIQDPDFVKEKSVEYKIQISRPKKNACNLMGYIDNGASTTVVIGAHYDHLGHGENGGSLHTKPDIHPGADDNASGTAGLIELAKYFSSNKAKYRQNFLFLAFSGEELGLLGSSAWMKSGLLKPSEIAYMFNMDMIGRLDSVTNRLAISGTGTSPIWKTLIDTASSAYGLHFRTSESGTGASDHTSFYLKDIPVLHFFSGTHADYHKPSDLPEKLNYSGEARILTYMVELVKALDDKGKLPFTKTQDTENSPRQLKVTLGIMPDYLYDGKGIKVDGLSPNKPAEKAGIQVGDIILRIGESSVNDMNQYMKVLGQHKKGETVEIELKRVDQTIKLNLQF